MLNLEIENSLPRSNGSLGIKSSCPCDTVQNPYFFPGSSNTETANHTNLFEARENKQFEVAIPPKGVMIAIR